MEKSIRIALFTSRSPRTAPGRMINGTARLFKQSAMLVGTDRTDRHFELISGPAAVVKIVGVDMSPCAFYRLVHDDDFGQSASMFLHAPACADEAFIVRAC